MKDINIGFAFFKFEKNDEINLLQQPLKESS